MALPRSKDSEVPRDETFGDPHVAHVPLTSGDTFPEGGVQAWSVAFGSFVALFSTFGIINSFGVFQEYYQKTQLPNSSSSTISLIGSIQLLLLYGLGPFVGRVFDAYGVKRIILLGSFLNVLSLMMTSLCQKDQPYQFFLAQSVLFGVGNALILTPSLAVISHWFRRRRAFVLGIAASGSAVGGVIYPIVLQRLIVSVGFPWAMRIAAFITLACLSISCITLRTRLPLQGHISFKSAVDFTGFKDPRYALISVSAFLFFYGFFIPYFYIETYANYHGVNSNLAKNLLAIVNAFGVPARIIPGLLADRLGPLTVLAPTTVMSGILVLSMWLPSRGAVPITLFGACYGLFSGILLV
ncbi:hypothetical protein ONZ45_g8154 [Pleurotus djamor]|nr:hypothetical protein ONZ45_g8154 [Pleurotus djamor]